MVNCSHETRNLTIERGGNPRLSEAGEGGKI